MMMGYDPRVAQKPKNLEEIKALSIDRKRSFAVEPKTVCLDLDGTLFRVVNLKHIPECVSPQWLINGTSLEFGGLNSAADLVIIPRPGLIELFSELERYANPIIYTDMKASDIDNAMSTLSGLYPDVEDSYNFGMFSCDLNVFAWSLDQCVQTDKGPMKYLGHLSERTHVQINDLWMITDRPEMVDIKDRVVRVSSFFGDPNDQELFKLKGSLFKG